MRECVRDRSEDACSGQKASAALDLRWGALGQLFGDKTTRIPASEPTANFNQEMP